MISEKIRDQKIYQLAYDYLLSFNDEDITSELLDKYLHLAEKNPKPNSLNEIYKQLLNSAQNANMKAGVIGWSIDGEGAKGKWS